MLSEISKIKKIVKWFDLNVDRKRMRFEDLKDINDGKMIDSLPISMNYFKKTNV